MNKKILITLIILILLLSLTIVGFVYSKKTDKKENINYENCKYDGKITEGSKYVLGDYTYTYIKIPDDKEEVYGWQIKLTDKNATKIENNNFCKMIDSRPIISTEEMYKDSNLETIDVSNLYTNDVKYMNSMFANSKATKIIGLEKLNTSNTLDMFSMFSDSNFEELNLTNFDTSKVVSMQEMFLGCQTKKIDVSKFDTTNVVFMSQMFAHIEVDEIDVSNFKLDNVILMNNVFNSSLIQNINYGSEENKDYWVTNMYMY